MSAVKPLLLRCCLAEILGTFILVFFGLGSVHAAVLLDAHKGLWQVGCIWGVAIMLACYSVGAVSGAHLNPAVTVALAFLRDFPVQRVLPYIVSQLVGSMLAAGALFVLFSPQLVAKEREKHVTRGKPGSEITAMCYGEYYPNPGGLAGGDEPYSVEKHAELRKKVPHHLALFAETLGTAILGFVIFALGDTKNVGSHINRLAPVFIGLTVTLLISVLAPLTQACFNPARDFGPRLFSYYAGWGDIVWTGNTPWGWLTVYILAPTLGACLGGGCYDFLLRPGVPTGSGVSDS